PTAATAAATTAATATATAADHAAGPDDPHGLLGEIRAGGRRLRHERQAEAARVHRQAELRELRGGDREGRERDAVAVLAGDRGERPARDGREVDVVAVDDDDRRLRVDVGVGVVDRAHDVAAE